MVGLSPLLLHVLVGRQLPAEPLQSAGRCWYWRLMRQCRRDLRPEAGAAEKGQEVGEQSQRAAASRWGRGAAVLAPGDLVNEAQLGDREDCGRVGPRWGPDRCKEQSSSEFHRQCKKLHFVVKIWGEQARQSSYTSGCEVEEEAGPAPPRVPTAAGTSVPWAPVLGAGS